MPIEKLAGGSIICTGEGVNVFQLLAIKGALKLMRRHPRSEATMSKPKTFSRKDRDLLLRGANYYIDQRRVMGEHWEEWQAVRRLLAAADPAKEAVYRAVVKWRAARGLTRPKRGSPDANLFRAIERAERKKK